MRLFEFLAVPQHVEFFRLHGEQMLYEKVIQGIDTSYPILVIQFMVDNVIKSSGPQFKATRKSVLARICRAMMAVEPSTLREMWSVDRNGEPVTFGKMLPAIAAAGGDLTTLRTLVTRLDEMLWSPYSFLPSPVNAATITGQTRTLSWLIDAIVQRPGPMQSEKELVVAALKLAIRTQSNVTGHMLFDALNKLATIKPSNESLGPCLFMHALKYDNAQLVCRALDLQVVRSNENQSHSACRILNVRHVHSLEPEIDSPHRYKLDKKKLGRLFGIGSSKILAKLIEEGWIQIDEDYNDRTLLSYALRCRQYDLAETVLQHGANINACSRIEGCAALWHAVRDKYYNDVLFLLKHDADNYPNRSGWRPRDFTSNKMSWLLQLRNSTEGKALLRKSNEEIYGEYEELVKNNYKGFQ